MTGSKLRTCSNCEKAARTYKGAATRLNEEGIKISRQWVKKIVNEQGAKV